MNKIFKNFLSNSFRALIVVPIYFLITPYTIHKIGAAGYGLWALICVIGSYQMFVDLGISTALIRYVAIARATQKLKSINEYLAVGLVVFILIPACFLLFVYFFKHFIVVSVLGISTEILLAEKLIIYTSISIFFNLISTLFRAVIDGFQRMEVSNGVLIIQNIVSAIGTFLFLFYGFGVYGLGVNLLITSIFTSLLSLMAAKTVFAEMSLNLFLFSKEKFLEIFQYSINLQVSGILRGLIVSFNKVLIARLFSVNEVTYYELAYRLLNQFESLINSGLSSLFPVGSELYFEKGSKGIEELRQKSLKYVFPVFSLIYLYIYMFTPGFVLLWLGKDFVLVSSVIRIFLVANYLISLAMPAYIFLNGAGFSKDTLSIQLKTIFIEIVLIVVLVYYFGFVGFCSAYSVSLIFAFILTHNIYQKRFSTKDIVYNPFLKGKMWSLVFIGLLISVFGSRFLIFENYFYLLLISIIWWFVGFFFVFATRLLTRSDISVLFNKQPPFIIDTKH
ncbi:MAG: oligosaccharide flippase family protein [Ignavibacteriales bacterium]|nr:oligosaccharide flippase family protein [Ignavibacteriales bacterium]